MPRQAASASRSKTKTNTNTKTKSKTFKRTNKKKQESSQSYPDSQASQSSPPESSSESSPDQDSNYQKPQKVIKNPISKTTSKSASLSPPLPSSISTVVAFNPFYAPQTVVSIVPAPIVDPDQILGYSSAQYQKFKEESLKLSKWTNQKLKDSLKANLQSMTGNKEDLIRKVADGIVLGRIPRCTACFGGRPYFDHKAGTYTCKGYHDDTEMIECDKVFQLNEIKRDPWIL